MSKFEGKRMIWIFSTRECATIIYVILFFAFFLFKSSVRSSILTVLKCALSPKLVKAAIFLILYASIFVIAFALTPLWKWVYLKDFIFWVAFAGFPLCFNAVTANLDSGYFRNMISAQLKFMVIVEFIISSYTFSLIAELILVLFTTFIALIDAFAETKDEYKVVKRITSFILAIIGISTLILSINQLIVSIADINAIDMLISFLIPVVFLFLFIPAAYLFAVYARYDSLFMRMSFKEPKNKKTIRWHHWEVFKICKLSYKRIDLFNQSFMIKMYISMSDDSYRALISDFRTKLARSE